MNSATGQQWVHINQSSLWTRSKKIEWTIFRGIFITRDSFLKILITFFWEGGMEGWKGMEQFYFCSFLYGDIQIVGGSVHSKVVNILVQDSRHLQLLYLCTPALYTSVQSSAAPVPLYTDPIHISTLICSSCTSVHHRPCTQQYTHLKLLYPCTPALHTAAQSSAVPVPLYTDPLHTAVESSAAPVPLYTDPVHSSPIIWSSCTSVHRPCT